MEGVIPNRNDVLLGRGQIINNHPGNRHFRALVDAIRARIEGLPKQPRKIKRAIAMDVLNQVWGLDPPGRFLVEAPADAAGSEGGSVAIGAADEGGSDGDAVHPVILEKTWVCADRERALAKVTHRLRERETKASSSGERGDGVATASSGFDGSGSSRCSSKDTQPEASCRGGARFDCPDLDLSDDYPDATSARMSGAEEGDEWDAFLRHTSCGRGAAEGSDGSRETKLGLDATASAGIGASSSLRFDRDAAAGDADRARPEASFGGGAQSDSPDLELSGNYAGARMSGEEEDEWDAFLQVVGLKDRLEQPSAVATARNGGKAAVCTEGTDPHIDGDNRGERSDSSLSASINKQCDFHSIGSDDELGSFLRDCSQQDIGSDGPDVEEMTPDCDHELTLREWIQRSMGARGSSPRDVLDHAKSALPVAAKLTAFLIEAERNDGDDVPLASIAARNVSIRTRAGNGSEAKDVSFAAKGREEVIEYACIMSCIGDDPLVGHTASRLHALGVVLYELFTGEEPFDGAPLLDAATLTSIHLNGGSGIDESRPQKTPRQLVLSTGDMISSCMTRMESVGLSGPLRGLVKNLLDCSSGDFRGDESYSTFTDVQCDLQLMMEDPLCFVDDIATNPMPMLEICDKCYGREEEMLKLIQAYRKHANQECCGAIISGGAGVGKSQLAVHCLRNIASRSNSYFFVAKFDQSTTQLRPMSTIRTMLDSLCETLVRDANLAELEAIRIGLENVLGSQAGALVALVPGLARLLPSSVQASTFGDCVDSALSMRFLLGEALNVLSSHSRPILFFLDDIQWADSVSLLLIGNLLSSIAGKQVFFTFCRRDDERSDCAQFKAWLSSLSMFNVEKIHVKELDVESVNTLLSESLHLSPRITRPLASAVHHKSAGSPLFLRQLLSSLAEQKFISFQLNPPRWAWDLAKIQNMEISDDVVALLTNQMQQLSSEMRSGLMAASCIGSSVNYAVLDILSKDLNFDLGNAMKLVSQKGFMIHDIEGAAFRFSHDKIEQSAYLLIPEEGRRECHMRYGLALCSHCLDNNPEKDDMLFTAVNQINRGGPDVVSDVMQKQILASLNLQAGRRSIDLSDYTSAFEFFRNGVLFLPNNHWQTYYSLSLNLLDAAAEAACALNKLDDVTTYTGEVIANAKCLDDKLSCLFSAAKALRNAEQYQQCMDSTVEVLKEIGEEPPKAFGEDKKLGERINAVNNILLNTTDDMILCMQKSTKKIDTLQNFYSNLAQVLTFIKSSLMCDVSLRMVELTIQGGLTSVSALGFAYYGGAMTAMGRHDEGCRLGRLALKLCEMKNSCRYKSSIILFVYQLILWTATPLQSIVDAHLLGRTCGRQSGDLLSATHNWSMYVSTGYVAGFHLDINRENARAYISHFEGSKTPLVVFFYLFYIQMTVLKEGLHVANQNYVDGYPGEQRVLATAENRTIEMVSLVYKIHRLVRAVLFRLCDVMATEANITDIIAEQKQSLRIIYLMGIFFEGLASFQLARESNAPEKCAEWTKRGKAALAKVTLWSQHSSWNWENKRLLLEAEKFQAAGDLNSTGALYIQAIQSAHNHKFIHEEAIACELAGLFYHRRGDNRRSLLLLSHSVKCYETWGAWAVAKRVKDFIGSTFGSNYTAPQLAQNVNGSESLLCSGKDSSKKRHHFG